MEKETQADALMEEFRGKFNSMAAMYKGWSKKIQFHLEDIEVVYVVQPGEDGTIKHIDKERVNKGKVGPADVTVHLTFQIMEGILKKEINPIMAMTQGLLSVDGDTNTLTRLLPAIS